MHSARSPRVHPWPRRAAFPPRARRFVPLARPARRAGARALAFAALGTFASLVVTGIALVLLVRIVRPG